MSRNRISRSLLRKSGIDLLAPLLELLIDALGKVGTCERGLEGVICVAVFADDSLSKLLLLLVLLI